MWESHSLWPSATWCPQHRPGRVQTLLTHLQSRNSTSAECQFSSDENWKKKNQKTPKTLPIRTVSNSVWTSRHGPSGHQTQNLSPQEERRRYYRDSKLEGFTPWAAGWVRQAMVSTTSWLCSRPLSQDREIGKLFRGAGTFLFIN